MTQTNIDGYRTYLTLLSYETDRVPFSSVQACLNTARVRILSNINLDYQIIGKGCVHLTPTTSETTLTRSDTTTTAPCNFDYSLYTNALASLMDKIKNIISDYNAKELSVYESDAATQNLFKANGVDASCSNLLNKIIPATDIHGEFNTCISDVELTNTNAENLITNTMNNVFSNCGLTVSSILVS